MSDSEENMKVWHFYRYSNKAIYLAVSDEYWETLAPNFKAWTYVVPMRTARKLRDQFTLVGPATLLEIALYSV